MDKEVRREKERRFDLTASEWKLAQTNGNEAVASSKWPELMILGFELYDDKYGGGTMKVLDTLEKFFTKRYAPEMGNPSHYLNKAFKIREYDQKAIDANTVSLSVELPGGEDKDITLEDLLPGNLPPPGESIENADMIVTFLTLHIQLQQHLSGRSNNPQKLIYYRMFFTDSFVDLCHSVETSTDCIRHERDVFDAMCVGFLDFFMAEVCRTIPAICGCALKLHGEMVEGCPMAEPGQPLPNNVYKTYLNTHEGFSIKSDGTISNQRDAYKKFLKENLC